LQSAGVKPTRTLLLALLTSCGYGDAQFVIAHPAPDPLPEQPRVSVFGVFKDGHLDDDAWKHIAPFLAPALGATACTLGYSEELHQTDGELYEKIDHQALDDGVTDAIVRTVEAHATGNLVFAMSVSGGVPSQQTTMAERGVNSNPTSGAHVGNQRARGPVGGAIIDNAVEITAMLYSLERHASLTTIEMRYTGTSVDDAFRAFAHKLQAIIPGASCASWKWK
jgi:hypothetical protein